VVETVTQNGRKRPMAPFDCEIVLRENGDESHQPYSFMGEVRPGTIMRVDQHDWVVIEVRGGAVPQVVCRPVYERM
jgi:hypothetical protein